MIKDINISQYRKLKDIILNFTREVNAISGANSTCKTSILHIISNSFQKVKKSSTNLINKDCLSIIQNINLSINPKIELLSRGDKKYNDPASGKKGTLYTVHYLNSISLDFRRHNYKLTSRFSIKPKYRNRSSENLPSLPVIYLGINRLVPYGEFIDDDSVKYVSKKLPLEYQNELNKLYKRFTQYNISNVKIQKMGAIKNRADFITDKIGVYGNTVSAGEDNLYIILTALVSLKFYFNSIASSQEVESILLIDELDASLHPGLQNNLIKLFVNFSKEYKIQIIFTTHSVSSLESMFNNNQNVIYLIDNLSKVDCMENPNLYKIKMYLYEQSEQTLYKNNVILVFTEDNEARYFIDILFRYFSRKDDSFKIAFSYLHLVNANIGSNILHDIFKDNHVNSLLYKSICILDGDQCSNLHKNMISLPGNTRNSCNLPQINWSLLI